MNLVVINLVLVIIFAGQVINSEASSKRAASRRRGPPKRMVGGADARRKQFPYQAGILKTVRRSNKRSVEYFYGGTLIHLEWVLTSAKALSEEPQSKGSPSFTVTLGSVFHEGSRDIHMHHEYINDYVNKYIFIGPDYAPEHNQHGDIGLLKLPNKVPQTDLIKPIPLPTRESLKKTLKLVAVRVSGWGNNRLDTNQRMTKLSKKLKYMDLMIQSDNYDTTLHAKTLNDDSVIRWGDSGGPATFTEYNGELSLEGIISMPGNDVGRITKLTRVAYYLDWIHTITNIPIPLHNL